MSQVSAFKEGFRKQCYDEVARCLSILREGLSQALLGFECRAHQLYHDRQEVTVAIRSLQR